jgi:hypothetical protein
MTEKGDNQNPMQWYVGVKKGMSCHDCRSVTVAKVGARMTKYVHRLQNECIVPENNFVNPSLSAWADLRDRPVTWQTFVHRPVV